MTRFKVRYMLADGTTVKSGGYRWEGAAKAQVQHLMSEGVRDARAANGALAIVMAWAIAPDGRRVAEEHQVGPMPRMTA